MKILITNKKSDFSNSVNVLSIISTEINTSEKIYVIKKDEIPVIKYSDTDEIFLIKDLSNKFINNNQDVLINISNLDLQGLGNPGPTYKTYTAFLTQTGIQDPVDTVFENNIGTITVHRNDVGSYYFESDGLFNVDKTVLEIQCNGIVVPEVNYTFSDENYLLFSIGFLNNTPPMSVSLSDGLLADTLIKITVYPEEETLELPPLPNPLS